MVYPKLIIYIQRCTDYSTVHHSTVLNLIYYCLKCEVETVFISALDKKKSI